MSKKCMRHSLVKTTIITLLISAPLSVVQADSRYWSIMTCGSGSWNSNCWNGTSGLTAPDGAGAPVVGDYVYIYNYKSTDYTVTLSGTTPFLDFIRVATYSLGDIELSISNGSTVTSEGGQIASYDGGAGVVTVNGANSSWINSGGLSVGVGGSGRLNITDGGVVFNGIGFLGHGSSSGAGVATIDGEGSSWSNSSSLSVGHEGSGSLNIRNGGTASNTFGYLGRDSSGIGVATIDGAGSSWSNSDKIIVGYQGDGTLSVSNGGVVSSVDGEVGRSVGGKGTVTIGGAGSSWVNNGYMHVGYSGEGVLNINNGGEVSNTIGELGRFSGSSGAVTVNGAGSRWTNSDSLYVGGSSSSAGGTGVVNIQNGGQVDVANEMKIYGAGTVNLTGGSLNAGTIDRTTVGAEFNFTGGILHVDTFNGDLINQGGTMAPGHSPGLTTVNGNYSQDINSTLAIEIGGLIAGSEYDVLDVTGIATLAGILDVDLYDLGSGLFEPAEGDTFDIVTAETITGEFEFLSLVSLGNGLSWQVDYLIDAINTTDVVRLSVISSVPIPNAMWLFGSGLIGITVFSRSGKHNSNRAAC